MLGYMKYREPIIQAIEKHIPSAKIYLYGESIEGPYSSVADVHLWLEKETKIGEILMEKVREELKNTDVPFSVEVSDVATLSPEDKKEVEFRGILWQGQ